MTGGNTQEMAFAPPLMQVEIAFVNKKLVSCIEER